MDGVPAGMEFLDPLGMQGGNQEENVVSYEIIPDDEGDSELQEEGEREVYVEREEWGGEKGMAWERGGIDKGREQGEGTDMEIESIEVARGERTRGEGGGTGRGKGRRVREEEEDGKGRRERERAKERQRGRERSAGGRGEAEGGGKRLWGGGGG